MNRFFLIIPVLHVLTGLSMPLQALPLTVSEIRVSGGDSPFGSSVASRFIEEAAHQDRKGELVFSALGEPVDTQIAADRICREKGIPLLVYGWIQIRERYCDAELKLFSSETGSVIREFHARAGNDEWQSLIPDLARKIVYALYGELGILLEPEPETARHAGMISFLTGGGYWACFGEWSSAAIGYGALVLGFRISRPLPLPRQPLGWVLSLRFGLTLTIAGGTNAPGCLPARLEEYRFRLPVELCTDSGRGVLLYLSAAPMLQIDRIDGGETLGAFGFSLAPGCELALGTRQRVAAGFLFPVEVAFFDKTQWSVIPLLYITLRLPIPGKQGESRDK